MTIEEQLKVQAKAKEYAEWRNEQLPDFIKSNVVRDALYCAYLEGAGIRTK
jgi:hypothetical protein